MEQNLATKLVEFFNIGLDDGSKQTPKSIADFVATDPAREESLSLNHVSMICGRLEHRGYLIQGQAELQGWPVLNRTYFTMSYDPARASYGEYEYAAWGFPAIAQRLGPSVMPVIVEKQDESDDVGTGFLIGNSSTFVTARHVVESMNSVRILSPSGSELRILSAKVPKDPRIDLAVLLVDPHATIGLLPLRCAKPNLLDDVLCIGYPPIPGFESVQISDVSEINSFVRSSSGRVVGVGKSYLDSQDYFMMNARVKGGNSGGPILNNTGHVVGVLSNVSLDSTERDKIDSLGYGLGVPYQAFMGLLSGGNELCLESLPLKEAHNGGFRTRA